MRRALARLAVRVTVFSVILLFTNSLYAAEVIVGRWLGADQRSTLRMDESNVASYGGWQTSGLTYDPHTGIWWSIGDQNAQEAIAPSTDERERRKSNYVYRISFANRRVIAEPYRLDWEPDILPSIRKSFSTSETGNIDFEGIAADPLTANRLYACTEGQTPWLVEMRYHLDLDRVTVTRAARLEPEGNYEPNCTRNVRWEGISVSKDGETIFLAMECGVSRHRLYKVATDEFRRAAWKVVDGFRTAPKVSPRPLDLGRFEGALSGLCTVVWLGREYLLVLKRNPEPSEIFVVDPASSERRIPARRVPLDLRAPALDGRPGGIPLVSASPEGIGSDGRRLVIITDPWDRLYKPRDPTETQVDREKLRRKIPLVFDLELSRVLREETGP